MSLTLDQMEARIKLLNESFLREMQSVKQATINTNASLDAFFLLTMAMVVFFMQTGFAFLEAGAVRSKHTTNILIKNILDCFIGCIAYYVFGYALAFGKQGNPFCGSTYWAMSWLPNDKLAHWFFQFVFAATSATIVSGALAERCEFLAYMSYSFLITGFVYPIITHWVWDTGVGWLSVGITAQNGALRASFHDFAGSGVVHCTGGIASLVAAAILGPRINRFDSETGAPMPIPGHSVPLVSLGGFILFFGFLAFNGGSQLAIQNEGDGATVARAMINTVLSGSTSALTMLMLSRIRSPNWSLLRMLNGGLAGMVAICAGCDVVYPWGACVTGAFAAASCMAWSELMLAVKIDDPVDAVAVHFGGGMWGLIAVAFLDRNAGILFNWNNQSGLYLAVQIVGLLAIVAWSGGTAMIIFGSLRLLKVFRVSKEMEIKGMDFPKHGEMAYPLTAYGHGWKDESAVPEIGATETVPEVIMHYDLYKQPSFNLSQGISNPALQMEPRTHM